jgi:hypothetical protein
MHLEGGGINEGKAKVEVRWWRGTTNAPRSFSDRRNELPSGYIVSAESLSSSGRKHVFGDVERVLLNRSEMFLTGRTARLNDFVFLAHELRCGSEFPSTL